MATNQLIDCSGLWAMEERALKALTTGANAQADLTPTARKPYGVTNGVGVIPVIGPITKYNDLLLQLFGGTSTIQTTDVLNAAINDPEVNSILLYIDSPGGRYDGTGDLADAIRSSPKPVVAYISDMAASGGYWIASAAQRVFSNATAFIGSIGVYQVVTDWSKAYADAGVSVQVVSTGEFKGAGVTGTQVTDNQIADVQREVDSAYQLFLEAVAKGRGMDIATVKRYADGRVWIASDALNMGLIDGITNLEEVVAEMTNNTNIGGSLMNSKTIAKAAETVADKAVKEVALAEKFEAQVEQTKAELEAMKAVGIPAIEPVKVEQPNIDAIKAEAFEKGRKAEQDRFNSVLSALKDNPAFAVEQAVAGKSLDEAKAAYADHLIKENKALKSRIGSESAIGVIPVSVGVSSGDSLGATSESEDLNAAWENNVDDCREKYTKKENFFAIKKHEKTVRAFEKAQQKRG